MWHAQPQALKQKPEDPNQPVHISGCSYTSTSVKEVLQKGLKDSHWQVLSPGSAPILMVPTSLGPLLVSQTAIQLFQRFELKQRDREQDLWVLWSGTSVLSCSPNLQCQCTGREPANLAKTAPRHNQKRTVWAVPRHSHYPPSPFILQIIPPFTNTQFSLPP